MEFARLNNFYTSAGKSSKSRESPFFSGDGEARHCCVECGFPGEEGIMG